MTYPHHDRPLIKLYGERNTGTHYLARLVASNLNARMLENIEPRIIRRTARRLRATEIVRDVYYGFTFRRNLGWKHMNPRTLDELRRLGIDVARLRFIMLTKNPYSWIVSMMRNPYHLGLQKVDDIDAFVARQWPCSRRENMTTASASLIDMWCAKTRRYLTLAGHGQGCIVRYEDLLIDPAAAIAAMASELGVERRSDQFVNIDTSAKRAGRAQGRTFESYRLYYLNEEWRARLTPTAIATINRQLDPDVMRRTGYEIIPTA